MPQSKQAANTTHGCSNATFSLIVAVVLLVIAAFAVKNIAEENEARANMILHNEEFFAQQRERRNAYEFGRIILRVLLRMPPTIELARDAGTTALEPERFLDESSEEYLANFLVGGRVLETKPFSPIYCINSTCVGDAYSVFNLPVFDMARVTHVFSTMGLCGWRHDQFKRGCENFEIASAYNAVYVLRRALTWREKARFADCFDLQECQPPPSRGNFRVLVDHEAGVSHGAAIALAFMLADDPSLTYDSSAERLLKVKELEPPNPLFELALRLYSTIGLSEDAECAMNYGLHTEPFPSTREDGAPARCMCSVTACEALITLAREHGEHLPPFPLIKPLEWNQISSSD